MTSLRVQRVTCLLVRRRPEPFSNEGCCQDSIIWWNNLKTTRSMELLGTVLSRNAISNRIQGWEAAWHRLWRCHWLVSYRHRCTVQHGSRAKLPEATNPLNAKEVNGRPAVYVRKQRIATSSSWCVYEIWSFTTSVDRIYVSRTTQICLVWIVGYQNGKQKTMNREFIWLDQAGRNMGDNTTPSFAYFPPCLLLCSRSGFLACESGRIKMFRDSSGTMI